MTRLENGTPFPAELLSFPDAHGQEVLVAVLSATFIEGKEGLEIAAEQDPLQLKDEYYGDPQITSVRREANIAGKKPLVDFVVNGVAYAPLGRPTECVEVEVLCSTIRKRLRVYGDRYYGPLGFVSRPEPFTQMPIIYERAFGGSSDPQTPPRDYSYCRENPVGVGYKNLRSRLPHIVTEIPNLEDVSPSRTSIPAGFGIISRAWRPRLDFAGTYDEDWKEKQWPLPPHDFDARFFQCAPADQQLQMLSPGEMVQLTNLTPEGRWRFAVPDLAVSFCVVHDDRVQVKVPAIDTIIIDSRAKKVNLSVRLQVEADRQSRPKQICIGSFSPGQLRARSKSKIYIRGQEKHFS